MANMGKVVVIAALDGTFERKAFGRILELVPLAEKVTKLSAVCMKCKQMDGAFSQRLVASTETELIGGKDLYRTVCRDCYITTDGINEERKKEISVEESFKERK